MELYNNVIKTIESLMGAVTAPGRFSYDPEKCWPETKEFELVMMRDAAYELGGNNLPAANCTCVTSDESLVGKDEILVYGPDLGELKEDSPYARVALLRVGDGINAKTEDSEKVFRAIQNIDFVKYHLYPEGFMARTSSMDNREQVRVSRQAVSSGISFERIGNTFIRHYKEDPNVLNVRILFITDPSVDYKALRKCAKDTGDITKTLSKIMEGMPTDCHSCSLKPICDEVEGMKELHFGKAKS